MSKNKIYNYISFVDKHWDEFMDFLKHILCILIRHRTEFLSKNYRFCLIYYFSYNRNLTQRLYECNIVINFKIKLPTIFYKY